MSHRAAPPSPCSLLILGLRLKTDAAPFFLRVFEHDVCRERPRLLWRGRRTWTAAVADSQAYGRTHTQTHTELMFSHILAVPALTTPLAVTLLTHFVKRFSVSDISPGRQYDFRAPNNDARRSVAAWTAPTEPELFPGCTTVSCSTQITAPYCYAGFGWKRKPV